MTVDEVLTAVPGGVRYEPPIEHHGSEPLVLAGHDDIEVAGVEAAARFAFIEGRLTKVTIEIRHDSPQEVAVVAVQQLVVLLAEDFGRADRFTDSSVDQTEGHRGAGRTIHVVWSGAVEVELQVMFSEGRARGTLTAEKQRLTDIRPAP